MTEGTRPSVFERNPRKTIAVLLALALLSTDFAFTFAYHRLSPRPARRGPPGLRIRSDIYHHGFSALGEARDTWGARVAEYHTNSLGLRDATARQVPPVGSRRRLVFIGDSFTEGIGVEYGQTFVGRVARALEPTGLEVLNAGCASYCPIIYYRKVRWLLDQGLRFDELVVFIDMGDIQDEVTYFLDEDGNVVSDEVRRIREERENIRYALPPMFRDLTARQFLKRNTLGLFALYTALEDAVKRPDQRAGLWPVESALFEQYGREGLARARTNMDLLAALLEERGIGLTVAVYPWPDLIRRGDRQSLQASYWKQWAAERGAGFIDYFPRFIGSAPASEVVGREFIPGDIHWNEAGHEAVAQGFLDYWGRR